MAGESDHAHATMMIDTAKGGKGRHGGDDPRAKHEATVDLWKDQLRSYRAQLRRDPQSNPIKQLALDISRKLEVNRLSQQDLAGLTKVLCDRALIRRAEKTRRYMGDADLDRTVARLKSLIRATAYANGDQEGALLPFEQFAMHWQKARHGVVFTAHPTFLMSEELREILVTLIDSHGVVSPDTHDALRQVRHRPDAKIRLSDEHRQAQKAIANAQKAVAHLVEIVLEVARELYPQDWHELSPCPAAVNSWVGYDMDGRTDIKWYHSIRFRLEEKRTQLERHAAAIREVRNTLSRRAALPKEMDSLLEAAAIRLSDAAETVAGQVAAFAEKLNTPAKVSHAANLVTQTAPDAIHNDLSEIVATLDAAIAHIRSTPKTDTNALTLLVGLKAQIVQYGLGTARMHFRINAMQLHNAIRKQFGRDSMGDLSSRVLLDRLDELISKTEPASINFASIDVERATAIRQFQVMAQITKHIDGTAPIRLLIAETEHAFSALAALYFARNFGIEDQIDISPLFETEEALEHGAQVIEILLKTESYRAYIESRGRLCVQTGFSDAGRFIGQVPAALAIERLQSKLSQVLRDAGLTGIDVLIFDTHGESMGRGAHPGSLDDRFKYVLSPWVRSLYEKRGNALLHEVSFQGGDGYVLFGTENLAFATLSAMLFSEQDPEADVANDRFYRDFAFSMDSFLRVKSYQTRLFENVNYREALAALGVSLLSKAGSRKPKRQFDAGRDQRSSAAEMRAIPHNAILQQMGFLLNIISGFGSAVRYDKERFVDVHNHSDRTRRIMRMVANARQMSSIKTLVAYASLFDDAYWVTRPLNGMEHHIKEPCLYLADLLRGDSRHDGIMHLATLLREDDVHLAGLFESLGLEKRLGEDDGRDELDILQRRGHSMAWNTTSRSPASISLTCCAATAAMTASCTWPRCCGKTMCIWPACSRALASKNGSEKMTGAMNWISCTPSNSRLSSTFIYWPRRYHRSPRKTTLPWNRSWPMCFPCASMMQWRCSASPIQWRRRRSTITVLTRAPAIVVRMTMTMWTSTAISSTPSRRPIRPSPRHQTRAYPAHLSTGRADTTVLRAKQLYPGTGHGLCAFPAHR